MRKLVFILVCTMLLLLTGFDYAVSENQEGKVQVEEKVIQNCVNGLNGELLLRCSLAYPQVVNQSNSQLIDNVNLDIETYFKSQYEMNCKEATEYVKEFQNEIKSPGDIKVAPPFTVDISYTMTLNRNGLLSLRITNYQYVGGAHPNTTQDSLTYDIMTGKRLEATDLLKWDQNQIKEYIAEAFLKKEQEEPGLLFPDARTTLKSKEFEYSYYLNSDSMVFYFNPYVISPYAVGVVSISLPYSAGEEYFRDSNRFAKQRKYGSTLA